MVGADARRPVMKYGAEFQLQRHEGTANRDGQAVHEFASAETIWASIRPVEEGRDFGISLEGQEDQTIYEMAVLEKPPDVSPEFADPKVVDPPVQEDDRIIAFGDEWRCVVQLYSQYNDLSRFLLLEDGRGETTDIDDDQEGEGSSPPWEVA